MSPAADDALRAIADRLREEAVIAGHVRDPEAVPALGLLVAAGSRAAGAPGEYSLVIEAVREGYLLHYGGEPRIVTGAEPDLALLAGDCLYALGLERLAALGDLEAVRELADLISLCAQAHADGAAGAASGAWLAAAVALAAGPSPAHERAKADLRSVVPGAAGALAAAAMAGAAAAGLEGEFGVAAEAVGFRASDSR